MSELTGEDSPVSRDAIKSDTPAGEVLRTPLRRQLDEFLDTAGWDYHDLTSPQLRALVSLISDRQNLLEALRKQDKELEALRSDADHDPLIPVYNRRAFMRELSRQLSFCHRYSTTACLIYMDLDRFKEINDRFGHATGDIALKKFGEILSAHTRESDLVGRLGGDEFAVLLIGADGTDGLHKAEMFREDVAKLRFGQDRSEIGFGLSCGVAAWQRGESADAFINRADELMYRQKSERAGLTFHRD